MAVTTTKTNKPINPRGNDQSPLAFNRAKLYSGKALDFDGVNDSIDISNFSLNGYTAFSICFHKTDDFNNGMIFSSADSISDGVNIYQISPGYFRARLNGVNATDTTLKVSDKDGFFVFTYDGTNAKWYYQAQNIDSGTTSQTFSIANTTSTIGRQSFASVQYLNGQIAGFKIFNTALTAAQVSDLYNNPEKIVPTGVADSALKLWLPMQEGAGTTCYNGAPDALGSEQITGFTNGSTYAFDTFTTSENDITSAIKTSGFAGAASNAISLTNGDKVFVSFDYTHTSGDPLRVLISQNASGAGAAMSDIAYISATGKFTHIFTVTSTQDGYLQLGTGGSTQSINASMENISFKIVSGIGTISGATWTHGIGAPVSQTSVIDWNKHTLDGTNEVLIPQGLTAGRDLLGNLFENVRKQGSLNLDGNSWAEVHDNASLDITDAITLEAWAYVRNDGNNKILLSKWSPYATGERSYLLFLSPTENIYFSISTDGTNGINAVTGSTYRDDWFHICATYDKVNMKIYVNGALVKTQAQTASINAGDYQLEIGRHQGGNTSIFNDEIAQPRIYNRALTAEEVERNYNAGKNIYK